MPVPFIVRVVILSTLVFNGAGVAQTQITSVFAPAGTDLSYSNPANWSAGVANNTPTITYHAVLTQSPSFELGESITLDSLHLEFTSGFFTGPDITVLYDITATDSFDSFGDRLQESLHLNVGSLTTAGNISIDRVTVSKAGHGWRHTGLPLSLEEVHITDGAGLVYEPASLDLGNDYETDPYEGYVYVSADLNLTGDGKMSFPNLTTLTSSADPDYPSQPHLSPWIVLGNSPSDDPVLDLPLLSNLPNGLRVKFVSGTIRFGALSDFTGTVFEDRRGFSGGATIEILNATNIRGLDWETGGRPYLRTPPGSTLHGTFSIAGNGEPPLTVDAAHFDSDGERFDIGFSSHTPEGETPGLYLPELSSIRGYALKGPPGSEAFSSLALGSSGDVFAPKLESIEVEYESSQSGLQDAYPVSLNARSLDLPNLSRITVSPEEFARSSFESDPWGFPLVRLYAEEYNVPSLAVGSFLYLAPPIEHEPALPSVQRLEYSRIYLLHNGLRLPSVESVDQVAVDLGVNSRLEFSRLNNLSDMHIWVREAPPLDSFRRGVLAVPELLCIEDSTVTVHLPSNPLDFNPFSIQSNSDTFEIVNSRLEYITLPQADLVASGVLIGPKFTNLKTLNTAEGPFPALQIHTGYRVHTELDLSAVEAIPPDVALITGQNLATKERHEAILHDVYSELIYCDSFEAIPGLFATLPGTFVITGDLFAHKSDAYDRTTLLRTLGDDSEGLHFVFCGGPRQQLEVLYDATHPERGIRRMRLQIGVDALDTIVSLSDSVQNQDQTRPDALRLRYLDIYPGSRLILNGHDATIYNWSTGTDDPLADLIPDGQNCVAYDRGLLCHLLCPSDINRDGVTDNADIGAFVSAFLAGDGAADLTDDGITDNGDILTFVAAFLAGC